MKHSNHNLKYPSRSNYKTLRQQKQNKEAHEQELSGEARTITDDKKVKEIVEKFRSKYGNSDVQKYYSKFDVGIEFTLQ